MDHESEQESGWMQRVLYITCSLSLVQLTSLVAHCSLFYHWYYHSFVFEHIMCLGNSNPGIFWKCSLSPLRVDRQLRFCVFNRSGAAGGVTSCTTFWVTVTPGFTSVSFLGLVHLVLTQVPQWTFMLSLVKNTSSWVLEVWQCTGTMEREDNTEGMCYDLSPQVAYCTRVRQIRLEPAWISPWSTLNDW